jgi:hypothetical protein
MTGHASVLGDPDRLAHWYGEVEGELSQGGEFRVRIALAGERREGRWRRASLRSACC